MDLAAFHAGFARPLERHPETGAYGRWLNPLGRWDWWDLGGRFDGRIIGEPARSAGRGAAQVSSGESRGRTLLIAINATQGFGPVPPEVWNFTIGGYLVLDKYLKSRRERVLSLDEIENVEAVANVLAFTIERMEQIDAACRAAFPGTPEEATGGRVSVLLAVAE